MDLPDLAPPPDIDTQGWPRHGRTIYCPACSHGLAAHTSSRGCVGVAGRYFDHELGELVGPNHGSTEQYCECVYGYPVRLAAAIDQVNAAWREVRVVRQNLARAERLVLRERLKLTPYRFVPP